MEPEKPKGIRTQAEDTAEDTPNWSQRDPEQQAGRKLRTQAEDTPQIRATTTFTGQQETS